MKNIWWKIKRLLSGEKRYITIVDCLEHTIGKCEDVCVTVISKKQFIITYHDADGGNFVKLFSLD